ncbi:hypothetical protein D3C86_1710220 [compost metagenome]
MRRSGDLDAQRHRRGHDACRRLIVETGNDHGFFRRRFRQYAESHLREKTERAERSGKELRQVEPGDILHHPAAGLDDLAAAIDETDAEQAVAGGTRHITARAGNIGSKDAADGRLA